MAIRTDQLIGKGHARLDTLNLTLAPVAENPYQLEAPDLAVERTDIGIELSENILDRLYWGAQRSWHNGEGQRRLNMPDVSNPYRYFASKGIDITEKGQATLLRSMSRILALTNTEPIPQKMVGTDTHVFVAAAQPNLKRFADLAAAADVVDVSTATETSQNVRDLATDGPQVYIALATDGIHRSGLPATTQREAFDATTGWAGTSLTFATDTSIKKEGTAALKVTQGSTSTQAAIKTMTGAPLDFSAVAQFLIWIRPNQDFAAGQVKLRLADGAGSNFFQRSLPALSKDAWYEDVSSRLSWSTTGAPNWNSIDELRVVIPANQAAIAWRASATAANPSGESVSELTVVLNSQANDFLLLSVTMLAGSVNEVSPPVGFTLLRADNQQAIYYQQLSSNNFGQPDQFTVTFTGSRKAVVSVSAFTGVQLANPINAHGYQLTSSSASVTTPSITTTVDNCMLVGFFGKRGSSTFTPDAAMTERVDAGTDTAVEVATQSLGAAAATGTRTATATNATNDGLGHIVALAPNPAVVIHLDDFRSYVASTIAHWSDIDARALVWAKDAIYGAGIKTGTQWRFFQAASGAGSTEIFVLPDGWEVTSIAELGGFIYFAAKRGNRGVIYAYDGTTTFRALQLPDGDVPLVLIPFSGAGILIGARRATASATGGIGILYRAFPTASGHLTAEKLQTIGSDDGKDYGIRTGFSVLEHVHYGWNFADSTSCGMGLYDPVLGGYSRYLHATVPGIVIAGISFQGKHLITVDGDGVWAEQTAYLTEGYLESSDIDLNIASDKVWLVEEVAYDTLPTSTSILSEYSTDSGVTWTTAGLATTGTSLRSRLSLKSPKIRYRTTLKTTDTTARPVLRSAGIGGLPAFKPFAKHRLVVQAFPDQTSPNGETRSERNAGWQLLSDLLVLRDAALPVDYYPPWYLYDQTVLKVRLTSVQTAGQWGTTFPALGGYIVLELTEVD